MATELDVVARLKLFTGDAQRRLGRLSSALKQLGVGARVADSHFARFAKRAVALGAMYLSVRALTGAFKHLVGGAFEFQTSIEMTRLGLRSMISNIEQMSFDKAAVGADYIWDSLRKLSVQSTATTQELHEAFAGSYGPMRSAGAAMDDILDTSRNLVHAAGALGIDMPQAIRDMGMMASGRALTQVKLFQRLRTSGFLTGEGGGMMAAQEWNALAPADRVQRLVTVLKKFDEAGVAAAKTLAGRRSTFKDIYQNLRQAGFEAVFGKFANKIGKLNTWLAANFGRIQAYLTGLGSRFSRALEPAFMWFEKRLSDFGDNFEVRIDEWIGKFNRFIDVLQVILPILVKLAAAMAVVSVSKAIVGAGVAVAGHATAGMAAYAGAGGGMAGLSAALLPLGSVMLAVAAVAASLVMIYYTMQANMESVRIVTAAYSKTFGEFGTVLYKFFSVLWGIVTEIFTIFGTLLGFDLAGKAAAFRGIVDAMRVFLDYITLFLDAFRLMLVDLRKFLVEKLGKWVKHLFPDMSGSSFVRTRVPKPKEIEDPFGAAPAQRPSTTIDMRGSTINIKQDFRQADPDRVAIQMIEDLARFAEQKITSGFVPALTG